MCEKYGWPGPACVRRDDGRWSYIHVLECPLADMIVISVEEADGISHRTGTCALYHDRERVVVDAEDHYFVIIAEDIHSAERSPVVERGGLGGKYFAAFRYRYINRTCDINASTRTGSARPTLTNHTPCL